MTQHTHLHMARRTALAALAVTCMVVSGCKNQPAATVDDPTLTAGVQGKIQGDGAINMEPIQVSTQAGIVTLNGQVSNNAARSLAANDASGIAGVRQVVNNLTVVPNTPPVSATATTPQPQIAPLPIERQRARVEPRQSAPPPPPMRQAPIERASNNQPPQNFSPPPQARQEAAPPPPPAFRNVTVPAGTLVPVRITQTLDSETAHVGDTFSGAVAVDVVQDGLVVLPRGSGVSGSVINAKDAGHFSGNSLLAIQLTGINKRGQQIAVTTDTFSKEGAGRGKNTAVKTGVGAAAGAVLGGIFGGGKGAAIGAAAGGGTGAGINAVTRGQQVQIPSETVVRFTLANPITVRTSTTPAGNGLQGDGNGGYGNRGSGQNN